VIDKNYQILYVDDFLPDPDRMRQSAIASGFGTWRPNKGAIGPDKFDGVNFYGDHVTGVRALSRQFQKQIYPNKMFFRVTTKDTEEAVVHSDIFTGDLTCLLYMSNHDDSGTEFYRHRPTDTYGLPPLKDFYADKENFGRFRQDCSHRDPEIWECINSIEGRYNRAVIFPSAVFHCRYPYTGFGHGVEDGRMIWGCHFYVEGLNYV
jgi:hypothetical protein